MPIEGPLRELGLHDVFQLLDLSRKTGVLRVSSKLQDDEGVVVFDAGRVVGATIRSRPAPALDIAELTEREVDRRRRAQIEAAVYDLMVWREGFFSFEEQDIAEAGAHGAAPIPTESLLMESARRIDEWSRITGKVPNMAVVPVLAPVAPDHESQLDLLPHEWEVLTLIDGARDLRTIASSLRRGEFETAKIVYGLVTTGVVEIRQVPKAPAPGAPTPVAVPVVNPEIAVSLRQGLRAARAGDFGAARAAWERFLALAPTDAAAGGIRSALQAIATLVAVLETHDRG